MSQKIKIGVSINLVLSEGLKIEALLEDKVTCLRKELKEIKKNKSFLRNNYLDKEEELVFVYELLNKIKKEIRK